MSKTIKKAVKKTTKTPAPKAYPHYTGAPISATPGQVFKRTMEQFKNCRAESWLMIDETARRYTFANVYQDRLKSSYDPTKYQYDLTEKAMGKLLTKIEAQGYAEVEVTDWPTWITPAEHKPAAPAPKAKRTRKTK